MVDALHSLPTTTCRPFGPSVTLTELASLLTPASRARRASSSNFMILATALLLVHHGEDVAAAQDEQVLAIDRDLGAAVLRVDDRVADLHVEGDDLAGLLGAAAGADGEHSALLGLLFGGIGDHETRSGLLFGVVCLHDDAVVERLEVHAPASSG